VDVAAVIMCMKNDYSKELNLVFYTFSVLDFGDLDCEYVT
jgi:hypothetical protein